ncbi:MAG: hypothetical protein M0R80_03985 [Proteobacteria bacterium]|jgi:hypothetical protein|nr:hypothetical protein [Pseudomonadota bacterium]
MALEMVKDAIFSAKEEYDSNVQSHKRTAINILKEYSVACVNRADYGIEISEVLKDPTYKKNALIDYNAALSINEFLHDTLGAANSAEIEMIEKKIKGEKE